MIRRRQPEEQPPWKERFRNAAMLIERENPSSDTLTRLASVERVLHEASADQAALATAIAGLGPEKVTSELKNALRQRHDITAPDTDLIASLRQRYQTIHTLKNQHRKVMAHIATTLVDLDTLAARCIELAHVRSSTGSFDNELGRLSDDIAALTSAHNEINSLDPLR